MSPLPHPVTKSEVKALLDSLFEEHMRLFGYYSRYNVQDNVYNLLNSLGFRAGRLTTSKLDSAPEALLDAYSIHRACNQVNEACNKLWATVELVYATSPEVWQTAYEPIGESFANAFLLGSLIPALYYSQLSAIVSCLSSFGCVSIRDISHGMSYNIVRTRYGWRIYPRKKYIKDTFESDPSRSWHVQVLQLLHGFKNQISDFPDIDYSETAKLHEQRNITHYEILSKVSATKVKGLRQYFKYLPLVVNTINSALTTLNEIFWLPSYTGASRFRELHSNLPRLYDAYEKEYPEDKIEEIEF